nr:protein jingubang [Quercus suber]
MYLKQVYENISTYGDLSCDFVVEGHGIRTSREGKNSHALKGILGGHKEDGRWVYGGGLDGFVMGWEGSMNFESWKLVNETKAHQMAVLCMCQTGEFLCSGSADKSIGIWKREAWGKEGKNSHASKGILKGHKEVSINLVIVSEDGKWVYGGGSDGFVMGGSTGKSIGIWERGACGMLSKVGVISGHEGPIKCLQASPSNIGGGFLLYSGSLDKSIRVWWVPKNTANRDDHDTSSMESAVKSSGIMMC